MNDTQPDFSIVVPVLYEQHTIADFLEDVLILDHRLSLKSMLSRLGGVFSEKFGSRWMESEKAFWDQVSSGGYQPKPVILKK